MGVGDQVQQFHAFNSEAQQLKMNRDRCAVIQSQGEVSTCFIGLTRRRPAPETAPFRAQVPPVMGPLLRFIGDNLNAAPQTKLRARFREQPAQLNGRLEC